MNFLISFTGYQCLHQRACDLDNPSYPTLKKEMQKPSQQNIEDLLFDDLFSADSIDGQNVIKTNSDVSLCKKASQLCCHPKATPPPTTTTTTTVAPSDKPVIIVMFIENLFLLSNLCSNPKMSESILESMFFHFLFICES